MTGHDVHCAEKPKVAGTCAGAPMYVTVDMLQKMMDRDAIVDSVRDALIAHAAGRYILPSPTHLVFAGGDCHVKSGFSRDGDTFTVKIATGFYDNGRFGLPNAAGMLLLFSQKTGMPLALFEDRGYLTAWRTAAACVLAAQAGALPGPVRLGIVGTGLQAELAATWIPAALDVAAVRLWGRSSERAAALAARIDDPCISVERSIHALAQWANLIVTTTPSTEPLLHAADVRPGTHIVALGADTPGKVEIDPALVARCAVLMTDDHDQCLDHGDFGHAVRTGHAHPHGDVPLGAVLAGEIAGRPDRDAITMVDLTGLAAQDDAVARLFHERLRAAPGERGGRA